MVNPQAIEVYKQMVSTRIILLICDLRAYRDLRASCKCESQLDGTRGAEAIYLDVRATSASRQMPWLEGLRLIPPMRTGKVFLRIENGNWQPR